MSNQSSQYLAEASALAQKRNFTREDKARVDSLLALHDATSPEGMRLKRARLDQLELSNGGTRSAESVSNARIEQTFQDYLVRGMDGLTYEERAQSISVDAGGGFIVPASFRDQLEVALRAYDGLFSVAGQWQSATGSATNVPIMNDTNSSASIVAENTITTETDSVFDTLAFSKTPTYKTGIIRVSGELSQDSYFNLADKLADAFGVRFARAIGSALVTAMTTGADVGTTTASTSAVTAAELLDCMASLDSAYWNAASWCMNPHTFISLMKLGMVSDASGQATTMWTARNLRLFDKPIVICPSMDSIGATKVPIAFGDMSKVLRREVAGSLRVLTTTERYAEYGQVGHYALWRVDTGFLKPSGFGSPAAGGSPVVTVVCHS
jgi:HK97 family phage major capsid protein